MKRPSTDAHRRALLADAIEMIEAQLSRADLQLTEVARQIATSRRQLQRCFDEYSDESFRDCLTRLRMERASEPLRDTCLTVREIADRVGYRQPAQFAKAFRRQYGLAPTEYRYAHAQGSAQEVRQVA